MDENNEKKKKKWRSYRANISANIDTNSSSQNAGQEFSSPSILVHFFLLFLIFFSIY